MHKLILLFFIFVLQSLWLNAADKIKIEGFRDLTKSQNKVCVFFENFDAPLKDGWQIPKGGKRVATTGRNGSGAFLLERVEKNDYSSAVSRYMKLKLIPNKYYRYTVWYRTKGIPPKTSISALPRIYPRKDDPVISLYPTKFPKVSEEWKKIEYNFQAGKDNILQLTVFTRVTGKIWYDDLKIEQLDGEKGIVYMVKPHLLTLGKNSQISFKAYKWGTNPDKLKNCAVWAKIGKQTVSGPIDKNGNASVCFKDLPFGKQQVEAYFVDLKAKTILAKDKFVVFKRKKTTPPAGATSIDDYGRVIIDGKPFLPVGIYVSWLETEGDVKRIADGGFNFIGNYTSARLNILKDKDALPYEKRLHLNDTQRSVHSDGQFKENFETEKGKKQIRASLDMLQSYNLKFMPIYTFGGITSPVFNHPAVFARYTADERPSEEIPQLCRDREEIAVTAPYHPVVALTNKPHEYIAYSRAADVLGIDIYPFENKKVNSIGITQRAWLLIAQKTGIPIMFVPQAFNLGGYSKDQPAEIFPFPTLEQLRTQVLNAAIFNVKWFCFYSYTAIWYKGEVRYPGSAVKFWPEVVKVAKLLRELSPWLLSIERAPRLRVGQLSKESIVDAKAFTADGKTCVLITATGPGKVTSRIKVPGCQNLKSKYGRTKNLGRGNYLFTGEDVSSDVLMP